MGRARTRAAFSSGPGRERPSQAAARKGMCQSPSGVGTGTLSLTSGLRPCWESLRRPKQLQWMIVETSRRRSSHQLRPDLAGEVLKDPVYQDRVEWTEYEKKLEKGWCGGCPAVRCQQGVGEQAGRGCKMGGSRP